MRLQWLAYRLLFRLLWHPQPGLLLCLLYRRLSEFRSFRLLHRSLPLRLPACWSLPSRGISRLWLHDLLRLRLCTVLYYRLLFRLGLCGVGALGALSAVRCTRTEQDA